MTRRELFLTAGAATATACLGKALQSEMAVEGYIFQQHAQSAKQPLKDEIEPAFRMVREAGFRNIELNPTFFGSEERVRALPLIQELGLRMPSVYVGGPLHEKNAANGTIAKAIELGKLCRPYGCKAIVTNPDPKSGEVPKSDEELDVQAEALNRMGRILAQQGFDLRVHHHTPQLVSNAREWRHILRHTDPAVVHLCVDVDWAYEGGFEPVPFLREAGGRVHEIHIRSAKNKVWLEDLEDSDIDYRAVARYLKEAGLAPLIVVELAYRPNTTITRTLQEDLKLSRVYAETVFGVKADG